MSAGVRSAVGGGCVTKWLAMAAFSASLLAPLGASAASPSECHWLRGQIDHYQDMADRAQELDSALWSQRIGEHLELLKDTQRERCPQDVPSDDTAARAFMQLLRVAGEVALTYFTFGAM